MTYLVTSEQEDEYIADQIVVSEYRIASSGILFLLLIRGEEAIE